MKPNASGRSTTRSAGARKAIQSRVMFPTLAVERVQRTGREIRQAPTRILADGTASGVIVAPVDRRVAVPGGWEGERGGAEKACSVNPRLYGVYAPRVVG